ncbi:hypothetical protein SH2C18_50300 [Clostridium sediminicola]|uniref:glycosyltransferase n=1 Tax=Clostridium sediminicola TaxID=3114879 RepID=UPI0031F1D179
MRRNSLSKNKIKSTNCDLLCKLADLYEQKGEALNALLNYKKALFIAEDKKQIQDIRKNIINLEYKDYDEESKHKLLIYKEQVENYARKQMENPNVKIKILDYITEEPPKKESFKPKIFFGTMEIGGHMEKYSNILRKKGYDVCCVNYYPTYLNYKADYILNILESINHDESKKKAIDFASKVIPEYDIFHFFFNTSLTLNNIDLLVLNNLSKKVIMHNVGSDIRLYSEGIKMNPYLALAKNCKKLLNENHKKNKMKNLSKYIDNCIVGDTELNEYVKTYYKNVYILRISRELNLYPYACQQSNNFKPIIVHAPTNTAIKGTKYIVKAIEELSHKYDFQFTLVQNISHGEAKKIYLKADIVIDQIILGSYGGVAVEAMAMGKPVISWISDFMRKRYPNELPIISANPHNIKEKIEILLSDRDMRIKLGKQGRKYVEKYHDANKAVANLLKIYNKCN